MWLLDLFFERYKSVVIVVFFLYCFRVCFVWYVVELFRFLLWVVLEREILYFGRDWRGRNMGWVIWFLWCLCCFLWCVLLIRIRSWIGWESVSLSCWRFLGVRIGMCWSDFLGFVFFWKRKLIELVVGEFWMEMFCN